MERFANNMPRRHNMAPRSKKDRKVNVQPNHLPAAITVEVLQDGIVLGAFACPQNDFISEAGNIFFTGGIKEGLVLEGEDAEAVLASLSFKVGDDPLNAGEVHVSEPRVYGSNSPNAGKTIPNTGGNLTVTHTKVITVPSGKDENGEALTVMVTATRLVRPDKKTGDDRHYALSIKGLPRPVTVKGPKVIGSHTLQVV
jgi:hypothetical protein